MPIFGRTARGFALAHSTHRFRLRHVNLEIPKGQRSCPNFGGMSASLPVGTRSLVPSLRPRNVFLPLRLYQDWSLFAPVQY